MNLHNDLLKACPKKVPTWRMVLYVTLGWLAVIALASMGCESFISPG